MIAKSKSGGVLHQKLSPPVLTFKIVVLMIIALLLGYVIGFSIGTYQCLNWAVDKAVYMFKLNGIDIEINKNLIVYGLMKYTKNVDNFLNITGGI